jgi:ADP-ribose pyrophosphatase YjhB (NUDIX family)
MKAVARAIIIRDKSILLMKRDKFGDHFYGLVGGHVELGESIEKALFREIHEETMVHVANPRLVYKEQAPDPYGMQYIYLCEYISGVPMLHPDADERKINALGQNIYTPMWVPLSQFPNITFRSNNLHKKILRHLKEGFPEKTIEFRSTL